MPVGEMLTGRDDEGYSAREIAAAHREIALEANNGIGAEKRTPPRMERFAASAVLGNTGTLSYEAIERERLHRVPVLGGSAGEVVLRHLPDIRG